MLESIQIGGAEVVPDGHVAAVERKVEAVGALQVEPPRRKVVEYLKGSKKYTNLVVFSHGHKIRTKSLIVLNTILHCGASTKL